MATRGSRWAPGLDIADLRGTFCARAPLPPADSAAVLRAIEIGANVILKGTRVDGVYSADPEIHKEAKRFKNISFTEVLNKGLKVMDSTAFTLSQENKLPIIVFDMNKKGNLNKTNEYCVCIYVCTRIRLS